MTIHGTLKTNGLTNCPCDSTTDTPRTTVFASRLNVIFAFLLLVLFARPVAALTADVGVTVYGPNLDVITNDWMPYTMMVKNTGPSSALNVVATTTLPSTFGLIDASQAYTLANNVLTFNLGTMTNLEARYISVRARPTNSGAFNLTTTVSSTGSTDPDSANNSSSAGISVGTYLPGTLTVNVSTQTFNFLTGLYEQTVQLSNAGSSMVASARILISGQTSTNYTYYAAGTNDGKQFVIYPLPLEPNQTANLVLQHYSTRSYSITNFQFQAFATALATLNPPGNLGANVPVVQVLRASSGAVMVKIATIINRTYTILYSDDPAFSHPLVAPPSFTAGSSQILWFDYGPPLTISTPTPASPRYYRVYVNPE